MIKYLLTIMTFVFTTSSLANGDVSTVQIDIKFLCELNKLEKELKKDKKILSADLSERMSSIKSNALRAEVTKQAWASISKAAEHEHKKIWKQFAKENGTDPLCFN